MSKKIVDLSEPDISINNIKLSNAQSMTVRVALGALEMDLNTNGLGEDKIGKDLCKGYLEKIRDKIIFKDKG